MVSAEDIVEIIGWAEYLGIEVRFDGGWGVDALLGQQTRNHDDVDLFVEKQHGLKFIGALQNAGFWEETKSYTTPAHTVWQDSRDRMVDLHLFELAADGSYLFEGAVYPEETFGAMGWIAGKEVRCIPPREQVLFHLGYEHDVRDVRDVKLLCEHFGIEVPEEYKDEF